MEMESLLRAAEHKYLVMVITLEQPCNPSLESKSGQYLAPISLYLIFMKLLMKLSWFAHDITSYCFFSHPVLSTLSLDVTIFANQYHGYERMYLLKLQEFIFYSFVKTDYEHCITSSLLGTPKTADKCGVCLVQCLPSVVFATSCGVCGGFVVLASISCTLSSVVYKFYFADWLSFNLHVEKLCHYQLASQEEIWSFWFAVGIILSSFNPVLNTLMCWRTCQQAVACYKVVYFRYSDKVLATFLSSTVYSTSDDKLFDVKVDDVQFLGYTVTVMHSRLKKKGRSGEGSGTTVNVVFALPVTICLYI